eukprot:691052-Pleurochrysis_carterae.AAC.5
MIDIERESPPSRGRGGIEVEENWWKARRRQCDGGRDVAELSCRATAYSALVPSEVSRVQSKTIRQMPSLPFASQTTYMQWPGGTKCCCASRALRRLQNTLSRRGALAEASAHPSVEVRDGEAAHRRHQDEQHGPAVHVTPEELAAAAQRMDTRLRSASPARSQAKPKYFAVVCCAPSCEPFVASHENVECTAVAKDEVEDGVHDVKRRHAGHEHERHLCIQRLRVCKNS